MEQENKIGPSLLVFSVGFYRGLFMWVYPTKNPPAFWNISPGVSTLVNTDSVLHFLTCSICISQQ